MRTTKIILLTLVSIVMFVGGIFLLFARIPFWSLLLGVAATQIGIVFLIFTYEKLSTESTRTSFYKYVQKLDGYPNKPALNMR